MYMLLTNTWCLNFEVRIIDNKRFLKSTKKNTCHNEANAIIILQNKSVIFIGRQHVMCQETIGDVSLTCRVTTVMSPFLTLSKGDIFDTAYLPCEIGYDKLETYPPFTCTMAVERKGKHEVHLLTFRAQDV